MGLLSRFKKQSLEYVLIYRPNGQAIYSKCFGNLCSMNYQDPHLLSGFLMALEGFAEEIDKGGGLENIQMGRSVMTFNKTLPSGHRVVIGLRKDDPQLIEEFVKRIEALLESQYKDVKWHIIEEDRVKKLENDLLNEVFIPVLHLYGGFHDNCPNGENCLVKITPLHKKAGRIWQAIASNYKMMRDKMKAKSAM